VLVLTQRPGRIQSELAVTLPRPRDHELLTTSEFVALKRRAFALLRAETRASHT
jgi:NitT/TauT family transport system ATP-binding protein